MVGGSKNRNRGKSIGTQLRVFQTNPGNPDKRRIFVWTKMGWSRQALGTEKWSLRNSLSNRYPIRLLPNIKVMNPLVRKTNNTTSMTYNDK